MQNLDDAAPEWLVAPGTTLALLENFHELYPECMQYLDRLRFIEQYDPNDTTAGVSQPFAYVADLVQEVKLGVEVEEVRGKGLNNDQWAAFLELRDKLAPEAKVGWYVVVCGDEERSVPLSADSREESVASSSAADKRSDIPSGRNENLSTARLQNTSPKTAQDPSESKGGLIKLVSHRLSRSKR